MIDCDLKNNKHLKIEGANNEVISELVFIYLEAKKNSGLSDEIFDKVFKTVLDFTKSLESEGKI